MMGFGDGSGWTVYKQYAPCCRQITTPTPHQSIFTGQVLFLMSNEQCQSTEGKVTQAIFHKFKLIICILAEGTVEVCLL